MYAAKARKRHQPSRVPAVEARYALGTQSNEFAAAGHAGQADMVARLLADYFTFNTGTAGIVAFTRMWLAP